MSGGSAEATDEANCRMRVLSVPIEYSSWAQTGLDKHGENVVSVTTKDMAVAPVSNTLPLANHETSNPRGS